MTANFESVEEKELQCKVPNYTGVPLQKDLSGLHEEFHLPNLRTDGASIPLDPRDDTNDTMLYFNNHFLTIHFTVMLYN